MSVPAPDDVSRPRRGMWSRLQSGIIFAAAGFMLGISVLSLAVPLTSVKAVVIKLAMGVVIAVFGFLIGLLLSRRVALWSLGLVLVTAVPTLQGIFAARSDLNALAASRSLIPDVLQSAFSITLTDIPRPVVVSVPEGFRVASTPEEKARRERLLNFFRVHPAYKGSYEEVLLRDWSQPHPRPQIIVSTIRAARSDQGRFSPNDWEEIKKSFVASNAGEAKQLREEFMSKFRDGSPVGFSLSEADFTSIESSDPNAVVVLSRNQLQADGVSHDDFSARKIIYHNGYIVMVDIIVAADQPGALSQLREFVEDVRIRRI